jgi:hypothetical protein
MKSQISEKIWTIEEDSRLMRLADKHQFKWKKISRIFENRLESELKKRWTSLMTNQYS